MVQPGDPIRRAGVRAPTRRFFGNPPGLLFPRRRGIGKERIVAQLRVEFIRICNVVVARVLHQEGIDRGCGKFFEHDGFPIWSRAFTSIRTPVGLYVRGTDALADGKLACFEFCSEPEAIAYVKAATAAISALNRQGQPKPETTDTAIERTIAQ